jgi:hypothetical protein
MEVNLSDSAAIDIGAVGAAHVDQAAVRGRHFDEEVESGEVLVLGRQLKVGPIGTADHEHIVFGEGERLALMRPGRDG